MTSRFALRATSILFVAGLLTQGPSAARAEDGQTLFKNICAACHTIGGGKLVGPDLKGVTERRSKEWMQKFIKSPIAMVKSGDAAAVALFEEFKKFPMPDPAYNAAQIDLIIEYLGKSGSGTALKMPVKPLRAATPEDIALGKTLFQGKVRFENSGPACNSCHNITHDDIIGGGVLARELTTYLGNNPGGRVGTISVINAPSSPIMKQAFKNHKLTKDEIFALVAFLEDADENHELQTPKDYGFALFTQGAGGFAGLMILYGFLWMRRKKRSVNHDIYARQIRSE